jgi:ADP-heptose:LPS heptosyltransferase
MTRMKKNESDDKRVPPLGRCDVSLRGLGRGLFLRFSSIGDIVLTTPVMRCLKEQYPDTEIHFATKKQFKNLLENNPYIDKVFLLEDSLSNLLKSLESEHYDFIIDLHNNLRTSIIKLRLGLFGKTPLANIKSFDKLNFKKWLLVNLKINRMPDLHIVDRYMQTVKFLGVKNDNKGLDFFIDENSKIPLPFGERFIAFAIGGQHFTKKLPNHRIIETCKNLNQNIILLGGKEDAQNGDEIANAVGEGVVNMAGKLTLQESAYIVSQSKAVITHDTGLMHIASALKKRVISIWGNTVPEFGMYPYLTDYQIVENKNLSCRPCSKIGHAQCPKGHFKCMMDLDLREINL